jgi:hypothetical protein
MIDPAPTTQIDPGLARGTLAEVHPATATKPAYVVLTFPNTDYRLHLEPAGGSLPAGIDGRVGSMVIGTVRANARRVDVVRSGGRYVEPVFGRPRRVQGRVVSVDAGRGTITVHAGVPIVCRVTAPGQKAGDYEAGAFVSFDVERGATIDLAE